MYGYVGLCMAIYGYLTIIPRARMGSESIAHMRPKAEWAIRDLKQPRRRAQWTTTGSVLTKPATSAHVSDVVHMVFRT